MYQNPFITFLDSLRTPHNTSLIEAIHEGYQVLTEALFNTKTIKLFNEHFFVKVFKNPTNEEIEELRQNNSYTTVRLGITDEPNPSIYAWDGNITHNIITKEKLAKFDFGFVYDGRIGMDRLFYDIDAYPGHNKDFRNMKNKNAMINAIRNIFPKQLKIETEYGDYPDVQLHEKEKELTLTEAFATNVKVGKKQVRIFSNPSYDEVINILEASDFHGVRFGFIDKAPFTLYAWEANVLHRELDNKIQFDWGFFFDPQSYMYRLNNDKPISSMKAFSDINNRKELFGRIKDSFPKDDKILVSYDKEGEGLYYDLNTGNPFDWKKTG